MQLAAACIYVTPQPTPLIWQILTIDQWESMTLDQWFNMQSTCPSEWQVMAADIYAAGIQAAQVVLV